MIIWIEINFTWVQYLIAKTESILKASQYLPLVDTTFWVPDLKISSRKIDKSTSYKFADQLTKNNIIAPVDEVISILYGSLTIQFIVTDNNKRSVSEPYRINGTILFSPFGHLEDRRRIVVFAPKVCEQWPSNSVLSPVSATLTQRIADEWQRQWSSRIRGNHSYEMN